MGKHKILYIHHDGLITGSAISLQNLLAKLNREKFEPIVFIGNEGPIRGLYEEIGVKVISFEIGTYVTQPTPFLFSRDYYYNLRTLFFSNTNLLDKLLKEIKPDLIHVNDKSALIAGVYLSKCGYKVIWHLRSTYHGKKSYLLYLISKTKILKSAKHLISISEDEIDGFENFKDKSIIYNSIDIDLADKVLKSGSTFRREFNVKNNEIAIGMIGNLNKQKGAWNFIKAASLAIKLEPTIKFRFFLIAPLPAIIDGINNVELTKALNLIKVGGLSEKMVLTGRRNDVLNIVAGLDIVSACYGMNAIGRPALEAASVGKPVIVNKGHTGKSSLVLNMVTGLVIEKENPLALANSIIQLAKSKELREKIGASAFIYARQNFNSSINTLKIESIYHKLLNT